MGGGQDSEYWGGQGRGGGTKLFADCGGEGNQDSEYWGAKGGGRGYITFCKL